MRVVTVIPAYNEEDTIQASARRVASTLDDAGLDYTIRVVDNGSTDDTYHHAERLASQHERIEAMQAGEGGKASAIRTGWAASDADILSFIDADLSPDPSVLPAMIRRTKTTEGLAVSSRHLPTSKTSRDWFRTLRSKAYNALLHVLTGTSVSDHQCGMKCLHRTLWSQIEDDTQSDAWFLDTELILHALRRSAPIDEYAITWTDTSETTTSPLTTLHMLRSLFHHYQRYGFPESTTQVTRHDNPATT